MGFSNENVGGLIAAKEGTVPAKTSAVAKVLDDIGNKIEQLHTSISRLENKIRPALMPIPQVPVDPNKQIQERPPQSTLVGCLSDMLIKITVADNMIKEYIDRVEL